MKKKLSIVLIILITYIIFTNLIVSPTLIKGVSMYPTYPNDKISLTYKKCYPIVLQKLGIQKEVIKRYDIVDIKTAPFQSITKRVIALPGETIEADFDGKVKINGKEIEEKYLDNDYAKSLPITKVFTGQISKITLGEDEYFVMGDNRASSKDSREFGPIKFSQIKGIINENYIGL